ncbi:MULTISPECIES: arginine deiminase family protein [unclassified Lysinibacillus]|uniref:arginine deiminase family protein n=1 Tax=unclassified Lysinibacillus TaxID=2636778 RepID=UPI00087E328C|nr:MULTISPECIES: arginine deiminase family protein [unclassified Lysinibacillus]SCY60990.1 arginine deiminase [Lysinibacillus sp. SG9]SDB26588.1 arginine deiminase [Lysinibacillus sp. TC-37]SFS85176.1 arginine deiminase [Lysinibacillus sp. SG55]
MDSFQVNCWSEYDELKVVMLCAPSIVDVTDSTIAEQVGWSDTVNHNKAMDNFLALKTILENAGVKVLDYANELAHEQQLLSEQLINRYFVRDLACVIGNRLLPGRAGSSLRRPEYPLAHALLEKWFPQQFTAQSQALHSFECGDLLILNKDAVLINLGMRTTLEAIDKIKESIFQEGFSEIAVIDLPKSNDTLHLDMNCNVVNVNLVIAKSFVRLFPVQVLTAQSSRFDMIEPFLKRHGFDVYWRDTYKTIPDINFINLNPETLLISKQATKQQFLAHPLLKKKNVLEVDVTELEKGGGGIRCMTLPLIRT